MPSDLLKLMMDWITDEIANMSPRIETEIEGEVDTPLLDASASPARS